jgi:hypothetical protein
MEDTPEIVRVTLTQHWASIAWDAEGKLHNVTKHYKLDAARAAAARKARRYLVEWVDETDPKHHVPHEWKKKDLMRKIMRDIYR